MTGVLEALTNSNVPLLSKTIATILRGRFYESCLRWYQAKPSWKYMSSWKHVSSNGRSLVQLFLFMRKEYSCVKTGTMSRNPSLAPNLMRNDITILKTMPSRSNSLEKNHSMADNQIGLLTRGLLCADHKLYHCFFCVCVCVCVYCW